MRFVGGISRRNCKKHRKIIHQIAFLERFLGDWMAVGWNQRRFIIEARLQIPQSGIASVASLRQRRFKIEATLSFSGSASVPEFCRRG